MPIPRLLPRFLRPAAAGLLAAALLLPGCGEEEAPPPVEAPPEKTAEEIAQEQAKILLDLLKKRFTIAQDRIRDEPTAFADHLLNLEQLLFSAEGTELAAPISKALADQKQALENYAKERLAALVPEVDRLVGAGEYDEAEEHITQFDPENLLGETAAAKDYAAKLDWIHRSQDAYSEYQRITRRALSLKNQGGIDDLAKAIGVLEGFPDLYSDTAYHGEVRTLVDEYFALFLAEKQQKAAKEDVPWIDFVAAELVQGGRSQGDAVVWKDSGDEVTGDNTTEQIAMIEIGADDWAAYAIELELKVPSGQGMNLGVTLAIPPRSAKEKTYPVETFELDSSDWIHLLIEYREGHVHIQDLATLDPLTEAYRPERSMGKGGIAFFLKPGQSIALRKVRAKVMEKIVPEPAPGAAGAGGEKPAGAGGS